MKVNKKKMMVSVGVIVACIAVIQTARLWKMPQGDDPLRIGSQRVKGSPNAAIQIVEYFDFRCGPCSYTARWLKEFLQAHPGKVRLEVRYFPLHLSRGALTARFTECALKQGKFWEIHDALMEQQRQWISKADPKAYFLGIARQYQLDMDDLEVCWDNPKLYDQIMAMKHQGKELGVAATPTFFINGKMVVGGRKLIQELETLLGEKLELL